MHPLRAAPLVLLAAGCTPSIQLEAPKEPIVINMNIKIEQEVRVRVDRDLDDLFEQRGDLFEGSAKPEGQEKPKRASKPKQDGR